MANTSSAQKAMRQAERRALRNQAARSAVRTYAKKASVAVASSGDDAAAVVREAVRALDKAAQKGIIHPNAAARRKSRLTSQLHKLTLAATAPAETEAATRAPSRRATAASKAASGAKKPATRRAAAPRKTPTSRSKT
jgi:small subunit ribosomal protein S20